MENGRGGEEPEEDFVDVWVNDNFSSDSDHDSSSDSSDEEGDWRTQRFRLWKSKGQQEKEKNLIVKLIQTQNEEKDLKEGRSGLVDAVAETSKEIVEKIEMIQGLKERVKKLKMGEGKGSRAKAKKNQNGKRDLSVMAAEADGDEGVDPRTIVPEELWEMILEKVERSEDQRSCTKACKVFHRILQPTRHIWTFDQIFPMLQKVMDKESQLNCRAVCKQWNAGVDKFYEEHPSLQPYDKGDKGPHFETPRLNKSFHLFSNRSTSLRSEEFKEMTKELGLGEGEGKLNRNPVVGRSLHVVEFGEGAANLDGDVPLTQFWIEVFEFLERFGEHIWYFNFHTTIQQRTNRGHQLLVRFLTQEVFHLMPNLRSLWIGGNVMQGVGQKVEMDPDSLTPAPKLETLRLESAHSTSPFLYPHPIFVMLLRRYHNQLKRLHLKLPVWELVSELGWPNLVELHIEDVRTKGDLETLLLLKTPPNLEKLGLGLSNIFSSSLTLLLEVLRKSCTESEKLHVLRVNGGFPDSCMERVPRDLWAPPNIKTVEVEDTPTIQSRACYSFLLKFPFVEKLNVFLPDRTQGDEENPSDIVLRNAVCVSGRQRVRGQGFLRRVIGTGRHVSEIVDLHQTMYHGGNAYESNLWKLMPRLKEFTFQRRRYSREGYDYEIRNKDKK